MITAEENIPSSLQRHCFTFLLGLSMLPHSSCLSAEEKIRIHRYREEHCIEVDTIELEKSSTFSSHVPRHFSRTKVADLLLGFEFEDRPLDQPSSPPNIASVTVPEKEGEPIALVGEGKSADWTVRPLPEEIEKDVANVDTISVSIEASNGAQHNILLSKESVQRLRGSKTNQLSWLDDETINGFTYLINMRSKRFHGAGIAIHEASQNQDLFNRKRVRTHVFGTHFFEIWNREANGGYENISRWRRKVPDYNSIGFYMFPAFVHSNHWVLAVIDVDGRQFIYYDPFFHADNFGVMTCAVDWMVGEFRTADRRDVFRGLDVSNWPVVYNPNDFPRQTDLESCGIFVLYVAEHLERGVKPTFSQTDISILRTRAIAILRQNFLWNCEDDQINDI